MEVDIDEISPDEFMKFSKDELKLIPFDAKKWVCAHNTCNRRTAVKDFGIMPFFYWRGKWIDKRESFFLCGKHHKFLKRLGIWYERRYVWRKDLEGE